MRRLLGLLLLLATAGAALAEPPDCAGCHKDDATAGRFPLRAYRAAVHSGVACTLCHRRPEGSFDAVPHTRTEPDLTACTACHGKNLKEFKLEHRSGVHGTMPCNECHDAHTMRRGREVAETEVRTSAANRPCIRCHTTSDLRGEAHGHGWLPAKDRHARMRCIVCHAPLGSQRDHEIVPRDRATRDCESCHEPDSPLIAKYVGEDDRSGWVTNPLLFEKAYVPGATRHRLVDRILIGLGLLTVAGTLGHGLVRALAFALRRRVPSRVESIELYSKGLRRWHWANAALVIVLGITGLRIHFGGRERPILTFEEAFNLHNLAGILLLLLTIVFYVRNARTGDARQYLGKPQDGLRGLFRQIRYYMLGVFRGEGHPYHASPERRFNPLQQMTYAGLMYAVMPVVILSGLVLLYPQFLPERIGERPAPWWFATAHYLAGSGMVLFLLGHLYLATTGDRPWFLYSAMITGKHKHLVPESPEGATDGHGAAPAADAKPPAEPPSAPPGASTSETPKT